MWYLTWLVGLGFAVLFAILVALWGEFAQKRTENFAPKLPEKEDAV
ncbi:cytochrome bd oxidase small subunit, CydX/CbdX family [Dichelobacter nodosus]|uniref:Cyd operon protein YbgT n=1 Tax=Dichelobacter nodosus (strain VCS1703A) TaxID=246195 RepID=A5EWS7_DICNV|nr:cytochrome bd oxidase small subunit, CydX/CbdX family [Dichelobacter nodosus]ABQ13488.1 hypothetical protein DNO_0098 [Dichelobacter nodosus VCS1703A]AXM45028.1 cytochrome bd oxidase small subunit, CydX/CbdX family [Dichelobacter nodosus]KNZ39716.1 membrane protein [Dichelobacter nodosus]TGA65876.1 cytochrome bd oxidase small subunit, CydX/CbdX family [Dichelobacter nodosus]